MSSRSYQQFSLTSSPSSKNTRPSFYKTPAIPPHLTRFHLPPVRPYNHIHFQDKVAVFETQQNYTIWHKTNYKIQLRTAIYRFRARNSFDGSTLPEVIFRCLSQEAKYQVNQLLHVLVAHNGPIKSHVCLSPKQFDHFTLAHDHSFRAVERQNELLRSAIADCAPTASAIVAPEILDVNPIPGEIPAEILAVYQKRELIPPAVLLRCGIQNRSNEHIVRPAEFLRPKTIVQRIRPTTYEEDDRELPNPDLDLSSIFRPLETPNFTFLNQHG